MSSLTPADPLLAELLELRGAPIATAVYPAPGFEGDAQARRDIRAKDLRSTLEGAGLPDDVVEAAVDAVQGHVDDDALGIVAHAEGVLVTSLVDVDESEELVQVEALPRYVPFLRDRFERRPHLVVRADRAGAQIARVVRGEVAADTEVTGDRDFRLKKVQAGGWSQKRFQNHAEHNWDQNAQQVADAIANEAEAIDAELIVVTGDERAVNLIGDHLPERWRDMTHLDDHQPYDDESDATTFERAETLLRDRVGRAIVATLERFAEHRGRGETAAGDVSDVLAALRRGAVDTLLLSGDSDERVHLAIEDPRQVAFEAAELEALGLEEVIDARLTDAAAEAALAGGAEIVIVPEHGPRGPAGPLGAILRF